MTDRPRVFTADRILAAREGRPLPGTTPPAGAGAAPSALAPPPPVVVDQAPVLQAIQALEAKLDRVLSVERADIDKLEVEIAEIAGRIKSTKAEIAALRHPLQSEDKLEDASLALGQVVAATEAATNGIMEAAEAIDLIIGEVKAQLDGYAGERLGEAADLVTRIFEACNFQDLTGQRITKVVRTLGFIEERVDAMLKLWNPRDMEAMPMAQSLVKVDQGLELHGPGATEKISQADIDKLFE